MSDPVEVFCLAEFLCDEMMARGWTTTDVAIRMGGDPDQVVKDLLVVDLLMCVHRDSLLPGDRLFDGLAKAFDVDSSYFRNLDAIWRSHPDKRVPFEPPESIFGPISRRMAFHVVPSPPESKT